MTKRAHIPDRTKLAAVLLQMLRPDETGKLAPIIPYEHAKLMSADQIISLFQFDHYPIPKAHDGPDEPWNLQPLPIMEHRKKTAEIDVPAIRKADRISDPHEEFVRNTLGKPCGQKRKPSGKIKSRGFQPSPRKILSRSFRPRPSDQL